MNNRKDGKNMNECNNKKIQLQFELNELNRLLSLQTFERNRLESVICCAKVELQALDNSLSGKRDMIAKLANEITLMEANHRIEIHEESCQYCRNLGRICAACS